MRERYPALRRIQIDITFLRTKGSGGAIHNAGANLFVQIAIECLSGDFKGESLALEIYHCVVEGCVGRY